MAKYTKRCQGRHCGGRILGMTSFPVLRAGVRASQCRFCDEGDAQANRLRREKLAPIERAISTLRMQLGQLEKRRLKVQLEMERSA